MCRIVFKLDLSDVFLVIKLRLCILEVRISQSVKHIRRYTMSVCLITDDRASFGGRITGGTNKGENIWGSSLGWDWNAEENSDQRQSSGSLGH